MSAVNYAWGGERPSARKKRLQRVLAKKEDVIADLKRRQEAEMAALEARYQVRESDLKEVEFMTQGEPPRDFRRLQLLRDWSHDKAYPTLLP
jgi:hypothetical protein